MPGGAWRSTSASRASRWAAASAAERGRGPTMAPMIALGRGAVDGQPVASQLDAQHLGRRLGARRRRAPGRWTAVSAASCARWVVATCCASGPTSRRGSADEAHSPAGHCGRRWPSGPIGSASSAGVGPWSKRSGGCARGTCPGRGSWASAQTSAGSARHPPCSRRCTAARSKARAIATSASTDADRWRRPPHPARGDRRLDVTHVGQADRPRAGRADRHDAVGRRRHEGDRFAASGGRHPRSSSPRT